MNYHLVDKSGQGIGGGIMKPQNPVPSKLTMYIDVDNIEAYCEKIKAAGGKILMPRMDVPEVGALALFEDPDGRVLGIWQQLKK